jgi:hypothetical protein
MDQVIIILAHISFPRKKVKKKETLLTKSSSFCVARSASAVGGGLPEADGDATGLWVAAPKQRWTGGDTCADGGEVRSRPRAILVFYCFA